MIRRWWWCVVMSLAACDATSLDPVTAPDAGPPASGPERPGAVSLSPRPGFFLTVRNSRHELAVTLTANTAIDGFHAEVTRAGYGITSDCPASLAAGDNCTLALTFLPLGVGSYSGPRDLALSWNDGHLELPLFGVSVDPAPPPRVGPVQDVYVLPVTAVGETSTLRVPIVNTTAAVGHAWPVTPGELPAGVTSTWTCEDELAPGEGCTVDLHFAPTAWGCTYGRFYPYPSHRPWVAACSAHVEARGRRAVEEIGALMRDGAGFLFVDGGPRLPARIYRLLADGELDEETLIQVSDQRFTRQALRARADGSVLWIGHGDRTTALSLVRDHQPSELVHVPCNADDVAFDDEDNIGVVCRDTTGLALYLLHADLSTDRTLTLAPPQPWLDILRLRFHRATRTWTTLTLAVRDSYEVALVTPEATYPASTFAWHGRADLIDLPDGTLAVVGGDTAVRVTRFTGDGFSAPEDLPLGANEHYAGVNDGLVKIAELSVDTISSRWAALACDESTCALEPAIATSPGYLSLSLRDGDRWLATGMEWRGYEGTSAVHALLANGTLDPSFANRDDVTTSEPSQTTASQIARDGQGRVYVSAIDHDGHAPQPHLTRYDASAVRDPSYDLRFPLGQLGAQIDIADDGSAIIANRDERRNLVTLDSFSPAGETRWHTELPFPVGDLADHLRLARSEDGTLWIAIKQALHRVSDQGAPLGDWIDVGVGDVSALVADGDGVVALGGTSVRIAADGTATSLAISVGVDTVVRRAANGDLLLLDEEHVRRLSSSGAPVFFGNAGVTTWPTVGSEPTQTVLERDDGTLDVFTSARRLHLSADGQLLDELPLAPLWVRGAVPGLAVGQDARGRLALVALP
jgi:hypothetical protein